MTLLTAHNLLPLAAPEHGGRERLLYLDHGGFASAATWRSRVRARAGRLAWTLLGRPRF